MPLATCRPVERWMTWCEEDTTSRGPDDSISHGRRSDDRMAMLPTTNYQRLGDFASLKDYELPFQIQRLHQCTISVPDRPSV